MPGDDQSLRNQAAFEELRSRIEAIPNDALTTTRGANIEIATINLLQLGILVRTDGVRARFAALPTTDFDLGQVDLLEPATRALLHLIPLYKTASTSANEVKLPEELVVAATELRARMLNLLEYHYRAHPVYGVEVADIRNGNSYTDLAQDLQRSANLYDAEQETVSRDAYYKADDPANARRLANQIFEQIKLTTARNADVATRLYPRAWTLAAQAYEEVRAGALFLFRKDAALVSQFQPLHSLGRRSPTRGRSNAETNTPRTEPEPT